MRKEKYFGISGCCMLTIMKRSLIAVVAGILLIGGAFQQAGAAIITVNFHGTVEHVDSVLDGTFNTDQTISGSYSFECTTPDGLPLNTNQGHYPGALTALTFTISDTSGGSYTGELDSTTNNLITVWNDSSGLDAYNLRAFSVSGEPVAGLDPLILNIDLFDNTQSVFSSDALPISLDLSSFSSATWSLRFGEPGTPPSVEGQIDSITFDGECTAPITIDIDPKSCPNYVIIKKSKKTVLVAILGTVDLDVKDIDIATIELVGISPVKSKVKDMTTPSGLDPCGCLVLSGDGTKDLILEFDLQAIIATLGDVMGDEILLVLTGMLHDGTAFEGSDCIVIKESKK